MCMYVVGSELALSFKHWFTTRRSRALKRRLSGSDDEVEEVVDVVVVGIGALVVVDVVVFGTVVVVVPAVAPAVVLGVVPVVVLVVVEGVVGEP